MKHGVAYKNVLSSTSKADIKDEVEYKQCNNLNELNNACVEWRGFDRDNPGLIGR
jgi:hypothetical protein